MRFSIVFQIYMKRNPALLLMISKHSVILACSRVRLRWGPVCCWNAIFDSVSYIYEKKSCFIVNDFEAFCHTRLFSGPAAMGTRLLLECDFRSCFANLICCTFQRVLWPVVWDVSVLPVTPFTASRSSLVPSQLFLRSSQYCVRSTVKLLSPYLCEVVQCVPVATWSLCTTFVPITFVPIRFALQSTQL